MDLMKPQPNARWKAGCLLAAVGASAGFLVGLILIVVGGALRNMAHGTSPSTPVLTVVAIPSPTPTVPAYTPAPTDTPQPTSVAVPTSAIGRPIGTGTLVEVFGTEGDGLRIRQAPSLTAEVLLSGLDSEVFEVVGGPVEADGFRWWNLQNPYDSSKMGWAVEDFLRPLGTP